MNYEFQPTYVEIICTKCKKSIIIPYKKEYGLCFNCHTKMTIHQTTENTVWFTNPEVPSGGINVTHILDPNLQINDKLNIRHKSQNIKNIKNYVRNL